MRGSPSVPPGGEMIITNDGIYLQGNKSVIANKVKECEDYVLYGQEPVPYLIVCDGCGSSFRSALGARLLAHAALKTLTQFQFRIDPHTFANEAVKRAKFSTELIGDGISLDATLLLAYYSAHERAFHIFVCGDGYVQWKDSRGLGFLDVSYTTNAPYYPSYSIDPRSTEKYLLDFPDTESVRTRVSAGQVKFLSAKMQAETYAHAFNYYPQIKIDADSCKYILLSTDGISQFRNSTLKTHSVEWIGDKFTAFKNTSGEFLKRRVNRAKKELLKDGYDHYDDLGVACFLITEESNEESVCRE